MVKLRHLCLGCIDPFNRFLDVLSKMLQTVCFLLQTLDFIGRLRFACICVLHFAQGLSKDLLSPVILILLLSKFLNEAPIGTHFGFLVLDLGLNVGAHGIIERNDGVGLQKCPESGSNFPDFDVFILQLSDKILKLLPFQLSLLLPSRCLIDFFLDLVLFAYTFISLKN